MANRLASEKFYKLLYEKFGDRLLYDNTFYAGKRKEVSIRCKEHGEFTILPSTILRSDIGCRQCKIAKDLEVFLERSRVAHGDTYSYDKVKYVNTTTPVEVVCGKHGSFWIEPWTHYSKSVGCMECFQERNRLSLESFLIRAKEKHGDKYDYSEVVYNKHTDPIVIKCPTHGKFEQIARIHLMGSGCAKCFDERNRSNAEEFIRQAKEVHGDKFKYDNVVYTTSKTKVEIVCPDHGPFWMKPNGHVSSRYGCPRCKESKGETQIRTYLENHGIRYIQEFRVKPYRYRYDFFLPDYGILIEYHGHQHFKPVEIFGGKSEHDKVVLRDLEKQRIAQEVSLQLFVIDHRKVVYDGVSNILSKILTYNGHDFG